MNTNKKIKVAAITGGLSTPSARFRVRQYISPLEKLGVEVNEIIPHFGKSCGMPSPVKTISRIPAVFKSTNADVIWFNKELVQGYATLETLFKKPRVLDADDAIWLNRPFGRWAIPYIAKRCNAVIAGNEYLADYFSKYCSNIHIIPTAVDLSRYPANQYSRQQKQFVIGWTGFACNYKYIYAVQKPIAKFLTDHRNTILRIISNRPGKFTQIPAEKIEYIQWTPDNEISSLYQFDVGIMPLTHDKWTLGKCSFKMLQYMAAGVPSIVTPVGMNKKVLDMGEIALAAKDNDTWYQALEALYKDQQMRATLGTNARKIIAKNFDTQLITAKLANIFRKL